MADPRPVPTAARAAALKQEVRQRADALGFAHVGVTTPDSIAEARDRLAAFLAQGRHGDMDWLEMHAQRRADPRRLMPAVRSIVMLAMSYAPARDPMLALAEKRRGVVSAYAKGRDYHDVLKGRLKEIAGLIATRAQADVKVFVDTAPLMEKPLAQAAGIGWQGKHTNLVSRQDGSWLFLGAILTDAVIPPDAPEADHCGSCRACLDVCPTDAFPAPYQLDARRCIAYLTIEAKGQIPTALRAAIGNRVFGCDDCLAVCPWNKFAAETREAKLKARLETDDPPLDELLALDDDAFRARFAGTPVKRTGRDRFVRNCLVAAGNSGEKDLLPRVVQLLDDPAPLVRGMAVWAFARLADADTFAHTFDARAARECDDGVAAEWAEARASAVAGAAADHRGKT